MGNKPKIVIHIDEDGLQQVHICGEADVYTVCEYSPNDRVFKHTSIATSAEIDALIGESPIGHINDARHAALSARIHGKRFTVIDGEKT